MTKAKNFKRLVRIMQDRTGRSYRACYQYIQKNGLDPIDRKEFLRQKEARKVDNKEIRRLEPFEGIPVPDDFDEEGS